MCVFVRIIESTKESSSLYIDETNNEQRGRKIHKSDNNNEGHSTER